MAETSAIWCVSGAAWSRRPVPGGGFRSAACVCSESSARSGWALAGVVLGSGSGGDGGAAREYVFVLALLWPAGSVVGGGCSLGAFSRGRRLVGGCVSSAFCSSGAHSISSSSSQTGSMGHRRRFLPLVLGGEVRFGLAGVRGGGLGVLGFGRGGGAVDQIRSFASSASSLPRRHVLRCR